MDDILYVRAKEGDISALVSLRITFLTGLPGPQTEAATAALKENLEQYFKEAIADNTCICWLAKAANDIAGVGAMTIRIQPGSFKNPTGKMGYIMNMYTVPAYRKKGICSTLLNKLMETGKTLGITAFELHATKEGEPVYITNGFEKHHEPTYRKYN